MCVEQREETVISDLDTGYEETVVSLIKLRESSVWTVPEFPAIILLPLIILSATAVLFFIKRRDASTNH